MDDLPNEVHPKTPQILRKEKFIKKQHVSACGSMVVVLAGSGPVF